MNKAMEELKFENKELERELRVREAEIEALKERVRDLESELEDGFTRSDYIRQVESDYMRGVFL